MRTGRTARRRLAETLKRREEREAIRVLRVQVLSIGHEPAIRRLAGRGQHREQQVIGEVGTNDADRARRRGRKTGDRRDVPRLRDA